MNVRIYWGMILLSCTLQAMDSGRRHASLDNELPFSSIKKRALSMSVTRSSGKKPSHHPLRRSMSAITQEDIAHLKAGRTKARCEAKKSEELYQKIEDHLQNNPDYKQAFKQFVAAHQLLKQATQQCHESLKILRKTGVPLFVQCMSEQTPHDGAQIAQEANEYFQRESDRLLLSRSDSPLEQGVAHAMETHEMLKQGELICAQWS